MDFDWDEGNLHKSLAKHTITCDEAESVFLPASRDRTLIVEVTREAENERRWAILGYSHTKQLLRIVFTFRGKKIRVISARSASRTERQSYENAFKKAKSPKTDGA
ncbi:MAG: BrnT family toxin [Bacteroidia bacterium]|nr:BrnT family toxin [Bacteroidia bacterium]